MKTIRRRKRLSSDSLYRFINRCRTEMKECEKVNAYLACMVLIGTSIEYMLAGWIRAFPKLVYAQHRKLTDHWTLKELNEFAHQNGFLDHRAYQASERIRKYRNMVHPNWYAGRKPIRFSRRILEARISDYNTVVDSMQRNV